MPQMSEQRRAWFQNLAGIDIAEWHLEEFVGAGRIGFVYRAKNRSELMPDWEVALKLHPRPLPEGWEREINKVRQLEMVHRVVHFKGLGNTTLHHSGNTEDCQYTLWNYISPGRNLRDYISAKRKVSPTFVVAVAKEILFVLCTPPEKLSALAVETGVDSQPPRITR